MFLWLFFRLDLDKWINQPPSESSEEEQDIETIFDPHGEHKYSTETYNKYFFSVAYYWRVGWNKIVALDDTPNSPFTSQADRKYFVRRIKQLSAIYYG